MSNLNSTIISGNLTNQAMDYLLLSNYPIARFIIYPIYGLITITALIGNFLVLFIIFRNKAMRTITNTFIANLSVSDILIAAITTPFTPLSQDHQLFKINKTMCHLLPFTMCMTVYVSTLTSTAIAADRFFVIVHPFVPRMKNWLCCLIIFIIWLVAVLISLPLGVYQGSGDDESNRTNCYENWPKNSYSTEVFSLLSFLLQFIVPCSIITYCYIKISLLLKSRYKNKLEGRPSKCREEYEISRKHKTNFMLIMMVVIFVICWIPLNILWNICDWLIEDNKKGSSKQTIWFQITFFCCHILAMSSAVYNPFLYAYMNENFKKEFRRLLPCLFRGANQQQRSTRRSTMMVESMAMLPPPGNQLNTNSTSINENQIK